MTKSNVDPDHYKTAGRERQGDDIVQEIHKQKLAQAEAAGSTKQGTGNFIPGAAPVGERAGDTNAGAAGNNAETTGQVNESANSSGST